MKDFEPWFQRLEEEAQLTEWVHALRGECHEWLSVEKRRDLGKWKDALDRLSPPVKAGFRIDDGVLKFAPEEKISPETLKEMHPWRKGPFQMGDVFIDTEWRSDWKWERIAPHIDLTHQKVIDIGCGNGYYMWRMLEHDPAWVLGIDPYLPYVMQFQAMQHLAGNDQRVEILPVGVEKLPRVAPCFDTVFSMGVLYHQRSPLEHLMHCRDLLAREGELILETITLPPEFNRVTDCLVPEGRYAKMKNVYFLPSVAMLESWLKKLRFQSVEVLDISQTTIQEQRSTEWMSFESLADFLNPEDGSQTIEEYPAPWRVVIKCRRP